MNTINVINENNNEQEKKEIRTNFMPKINRQPKTKLFYNKLSPNLTKYIFNFLPYKEVYEIGKLNLFLMNNVIDYFKQAEPWPEKIRKLKSKYNFEVYQKEIDETEKEAKIKKRRYKYSSENNVNYYQYDIDGNIYISIARTFSWAHKDDPDYWTESKIEGSYQPNGNVPYLETVCWLDTNFTFFHVKPNNYKLFLNETFVKGLGFIEKAFIKVLIEDKIIYEKKFPSKEMYNNNKSKKEDCKLKEDFICFIKREDFGPIISEKKLDENGNCKVKVSFWHADDFWKDGWFIDGGCLREIGQKEMDKEIEEMNKKREEEEKNRLFNNQEGNGDDSEDEFDDDDDNDFNDDNDDNDDNDNNNDNDDNNDDNDNNDNNDNNDDNEDNGDNDDNVEV